MAVSRLSEQQVGRLLAAIATTLRAREGLVAQSDGRLEIKTYPKGDGFDVELIVKTR